MEQTPLGNYSSLCRDVNDGVAAIALDQYDRRKTGAGIL